MELRARIASALQQAKNSDDTDRLCTLRLVNAALRDKELATAGPGEGEGARPSLTEDEVRGILGRMVRQRQESASAYEEAGRLDLAEQERAEIAVIEDFLPRQLSEEEINTAISGAIDETDAHSIRDLGRVMGSLKSNYSGRMDFCSVGPRVRERLG